ncbi:hypothetical protein QYM36_009462 [Artemia franciscana]|nr:hypothetical protein QYM36_009462 [Artemia franciscana]
MLGMYSQALQDARESVKCEPSFAKGHLRMGKCFLAMGDVAAAKSAFDKTKELEPTNTTIDAELRTIDTLNKIDTDLNRAVEVQDYRKALYCSERALDIAVFCRRYKVKKAESLTHLGRYQEAEEIVNDILRSDSTDVDSLLIRGMCLYYQDNIDLAFSHFQQVLRLAPDYAKARETYRKAKQLKTKKEEGNVAFKQGKLQEALAIYTETLAIDPVNKLTNSKVYYNRALVNSKLGNHSQTVDDCSAALKLNDGYIKALLLRAKSYGNLEKHEECVRDYEACMKLEKNANRETRRLLKEAKIALKRSKRKDYYKILGVDKNANDDEIKKAYRKRALVHHPDRHSSATEEERKEHEKNFKDLGEAYTVLSDPKKKARYDRGQDLDDEGHASSTLKSKYEFFDEAKPTRIYDAHELEGIEDAQWETIEELEEIPRADEKFYGINLKRGEHGIFDIEELVEILRNENLIDICVVKIPKQIQYCDFMVIATVKSGRQRAGIAEFVRQVSKRKKLPKDPFPIIEGTFKDSWIAMDLGNIVLHMFDDETRQQYDLETLWAVGPNFDDPRHSDASEYEQFLTQVNLNSKQNFCLVPPAFTNSQNSPQKSHETS